MLTIAVNDTANDTAVPRPGDRQVAGAKADTGECGLFMAAVQALLMPGPAAVPQPQNETGFGGPPSTKAANLAPPAPPLLAGLQEDGAGIENGTSLQEVNPPVSTAENSPGKEFEPLAEMQGLVPGMPAVTVIQPVPDQSATVAAPQSLTQSLIVAAMQAPAVAAGQTALPGQPITAAGKTLHQQPAAGQNDAQVSLAKAGLDQVAAEGVRQRDEPSSRQNATAVQKDHNGIDGAVVREVPAVNGTGPPAGKELQVIIENKAQKTEGPGTLKPPETGLKTELEQADGSFPQMHALPGDAALPAAKENPGSVAMSNLQERVVQEIKNILTAGKKGQTEVELKLEPEHLGRITIKLFFDSDALSAHFFTGNNHVKEILEASLQQLRDSLSRYDLRLNEALVFTGNDGRSGMGRSFEEQNGRAWSGYSGYNDRTYVEARAETVHFATAATGTVQVNYLI